MTMSPTPRHDCLTPALKQASQAAGGFSRKVGTKPELILRRTLGRRGLRYRGNSAELAGQPDIVYRNLELLSLSTAIFGTAETGRRSIPSSIADTTATIGFERPKGTWLVIVSQAVHCVRQVRFPRLH